RDVYVRVAEASEVPVDEYGPVLYKADVVAADVDVDEGVTVEGCACGSGYEDGQGMVEPGWRDEAEGEEGRGITHALCPVLDALEVFETGQAVGREGVDLVEGETDGVETGGRPGRRPEGVAEVFEDEERVLGAVVPGEAAR